MSFLKVMEQLYVDDNEGEKLDFIECENDILVKIDGHCVIINDSS